MRISISLKKVFLRWKQALDIFSEMQMAGVKADLYCYNAILSALEKGRQSAKAFIIFSDMEKNQIQPNTLSFNTLLSAYGREAK